MPPEGAGSGSLRKEERKLEVGSDDDVVANSDGGLGASSTDDSVSEGCS